MKDLFKQLDKSNDGKLSKEEIKEGLELLSEKMQMSASELETMMHDIDTDNSGYVDYSEFVTATINKAWLLSEENLKSAFLQLDKDQSGSVTISELRVVLESEGSK